MNFVLEKWLTSIKFFSTTAVFNKANPAKQYILTVLKSVKQV